MNAPIRLRREIGRLFTKSTGKAGMPPGSLVFVGKRVQDETRIRVMDYDEEELREWRDSTVEDCLALKETSTVSWIDVDGLVDVETIRRLGEGFNIHPLVLEDILDTGQRPKIEVYDDCIYIVLKLLSFDASEARVDSEQISIVFGKNYVISFQEREGNIFNSIMERIRSRKGRIRTMGPDFLAYALMDSIIDGYFVVMEAIGDLIEDIDLKVTSGEMDDAPNQINSLKRQMLVMRRSLWPLREVIGSMSRSESDLIKESTGIFIRDIYDHTIELIETVDTCRDLLSSLLDLHMSQISNRMNEVMQVLTIIATIFIPLTFIAGVYGMNFLNIPELQWRYGYYLIWGIMILIALLLVGYFRKKKWF